MPISPLRSCSRSLLVLAAPLVCSSCFTMALWGFLPEDDAEDDASFAYDSRTEWSWSAVLVRVLATPFSLALDCVTCPVQAVLLGDGDDDECKCPSSR